MRKEKKMKAKELAEQLMQNPDFEVQAMFVNHQEKGWPNYQTLSVDGIADVGHSSKIIILDVNQKD